LSQASADPQRLCATAEWNCSDFTWAPQKCRSNASACWGQVDGRKYQEILLETHAVVIENELAGVSSILGLTQNGE